MDRVERAKVKLQRLQRLHELAKKNLDRLVIVRPLSKNQKEFLKMWRTNLTASEIADVLEVSRPMVYKLINDLSRHEVIEYEKKKG